MIFVGDIGGTKTNFAVYRFRQTHCDSITEQTFSSSGFRSLKSLITVFYKTLPASVRREIAGACLAVAGPVLDQHSVPGNLSWKIHPFDVTEATGIENVILINDLEATAYGLPFVSKHDLVSLNQGITRRGNAAIIAAGTGLGEAVLYWDGADFQPSASEGGQADFAPRGSLQTDLLRHLEHEFGKVSCERVISGPGLRHIFDFLKRKNHYEEPDWLRERLQKEDAGAVIADLAIQGKVDICVRALDVFISAYAAEAANLALRVMALGGIYIAGGIAPKIIEKMKEGAFLTSFISHTKLSSLLQGIPITVILDPKAPLYGAARFFRIRTQNEKQLSLQVSS